MIDRIRSLLAERQMTASSFADKLGVPRSTISHILSGRNKPSLEMVNKILDAFPDLRTEWLVRGDGLMFKYEARKPPADLFSQDDHASSSDRPIEKPYLENQQKEKEGDLPIPEHKAYRAPFTKDHKNSEKNYGETDFPKHNEKQQVTSGTHQDNYAKQAGFEKITEKIIVLYSDGSFSEYISR